jgi:DNA invertase Pin-like site-specific DNA recombinase
MEARELKVCGYCRVSTLKKSAHSTSDRVVFEQNLEVQERGIRERSAASGWKLVEVFSDRESGAKESRPGLDALLDAARRRKFSVLVVSRLDRLARSLRQLVLLLDELRALKISFVSLKENLETETPAGRAMFGMIAVFAEFEREIMRERIIMGMAHAAIHGTKSGLPPGRPKRVFDRQRASDMLAAGEGWKEIAGKLGVSVSTLWRHVQKGRLAKLLPVEQNKEK